PRNVTGEPTVRPATESWKNATTRNRVVNKLDPANIRMATTPSARAPNTKAPTAVDLLIDMADPLSSVFVRWSFPMHESADRGMITGFKQFFRRTSGNSSFCIGIQEDAVITNAQQTGQFVTDKNHCDTESVTQIHDQIIKTSCSDRVQTSRRFVQ